jgi:hypothetical protein
VVLIASTRESLKYYANVQTCLFKNTKIVFKNFGTQELDVLKEIATSSCRAWKDAGKPKHGNIFRQYINDKLLYEKRFREEQAMETSIFTNDLHDALQKKSMCKTFGKFGNQNLKIKF